ncbi:signal peptidase I [Galbibacter pacificus]|uniref:Signal peptidase I n=1 Tax=Galbibacter pacificus TaxID=2996052 RepID=A0ABT6FNP2_9FLAO|nr:signal peptidase I [Galbibacter pacificus]MDG3581352.1 signal peptidase I [Galbibacter pacificus]MDG3584830.1 signal peptidase I [Galbibacter pacificus]
MTMTQWFIFFLVIQVIHFLATWKLYIKAGRKPWEAIVPIYNAVILMKIINRPWWWVILLFIPIINLIMIPVVWVETIRSFGRNSTADTWLVILTLGFYIFYVNYALDATYIEDRDLKPRTATGEWVSSILFAIVAATLVHTYFMQPYVIPTSSLEKTLLVGDFLFVSKFHYGARTPMTTVAFPMVHDTIPVLNTKSYINKPQLPYFRLPGLQKIKRNDIVVFSWPTDTVEQFFKITHRKIRKPIDKKSNYVKRCVGLPGDSLSIKDGYVYINNKRLELPDRAKPQYSYYVQAKGNLTPRYMYERYGVTGSFGQVKQGIYYFSAMTEKAADMLKDNPNVISVKRNIESKGASKMAPVFPQSSKCPWNQDQYGSIYIPQKGKTVELNLDVLPLYKRIIERYEGNTVQVNGSQISINNKPATTYTFKQDYYWMMGDNRHASEDSRYWGYVPEDHVVGKPVFIWFSWDSNASGPFWNKVRWDRVFTTVGGEGKPRSYLVYFLVALALWYGYSKFKKRKKGNS